jgi:hypothetical protein
MANAAAQVTGLNATVDLDAALEKRLQLSIGSGSLRLTKEALQRLLPPTAAVELRLEGITSGRVQIRATWQGIPFIGDILPEATPEGRLRFQMTGARAVFVPVPASAVAPVVIKNLVYEKIKNAPGIYLVGDKILEVDLTELLAPLGITLARLTRVGVGQGWVELQF